MNRPLQTKPDYGSRARVGIGVPHSNPTVEPELRALLPAAIGVYATRLTHPAAQVEVRLKHYIRNLAVAIKTFGVMKLGAFGFGCTGSSYVAGLTLETQLVSAAGEECGIPVVTAAQAIRLALNSLGCRTVALVSPYPVELAEAGYRYWADAGVRIVTRLRVDPDLTDTHRIYELTSGDALDALRQLDLTGAECLLASGTGMPTLRALRTLGAETDLPVLSSNLALAWALMTVAAPELAPATPSQLLAEVQSLEG